MADPVSMTIPPELATRWRAAQDELTRAAGSLAHPRPDDSFAEMSDQLATAHETIASLYAELVELPDVAELVAAAASIAAEHHRAAASAERERVYAW